MRPRLCAVICLAGLLSAAGETLAQTPVVPLDTAKSGLVYRDSVSFFVTPPRGWLLDSEVARHQGPLAVFYRAGESWATGRAVMYVNLIELLGSGADALRRTISDEAARWSEGVFDATVEPLPALRSGTGHVAEVRRFASPSHRSYEAVAYIRQGGSVAVLVMTARTQLDFAGAYPAFEALVKSYGPGPTIKQR